MGVPKFYRWLSERYPLINRPVTEASMPEVDNFYLDANGILHKCTHGDDAASVTKSVDDSLVLICNYIDDLVQKVRPRRLVYIAIDGCAPRAKMNQQRSRRYRVAREREREAETQRAEKAAAAAKELPTVDPPAAAAAAAGEEAGEEAKPAAVAAPDATEVEEVEAAFDSNHITPGTEFMARVSEMLRYFIRYKLQHDDLWRGAPRQPQRNATLRPTTAPTPPRRGSDPRPPPRCHGRPNRRVSRSPATPRHATPRRNHGRASRRALGRRGAGRGRAQDHGAHPLGARAAQAPLRLRPRRRPHLPRPRDMVKMAMMSASGWV